MNKRIRKKKAKQARLKAEAREKYLKALEKIVRLMWSHYELIDTPLLRMQSRLTDMSVPEWHVKYSYER